MAMTRSLSATSNDNLYETLKPLEHLVHFAHWAYLNDDGAEFRMYAAELEGSLKARYLRIKSPFSTRRPLLTPSTTRVHLGIRTCDTLVLAFPGCIFPIAWEDFLQPTQFRGFLANVWTDISFGLTKIDWPNADLLNVLVHEGFLLAFNNIVQDDRWLEYIDQLRRDISGQDFKKIEICGHGLGGALATLCALWCNIRWPNMDITCVTLGSPRVGNQNFVEEFNERKIRCYRFMLDYDPIPNLPNRYTEAMKLPIPPTDPGERRYKHVGKPIWLRRQDGTPGARLGENSPSVASEERAKNLSLTEIRLHFPVFFQYQLFSVARAGWKAWSHSPMAYATAVQMILENEKGRKDKVRVLRDIIHLVRYASSGYMDEEEFRVVNYDLHGPITSLKLQIWTSFWKNAGMAITPNMHVHLGVGRGDTLVLAFGGNDLPMRYMGERLLGLLGNLWTSFSFGLTKIDWPNADLPNVLVHKGFLLAFNNVIQDDKWLKHIDQLQGHTSGQNFKKIEICGHGLWGALATLCALWCNIRWPNMDITCVTLGSPRVGNQNFVEEFNKRKIHCYRLVEQYDPIPTVPDRYSQAVSIEIPPTYPGLSIRERKYRHAGESLSLWQHVNGEIILRDFDPPGVNDEEIAGDLSIPVNIGLRLGWLAPYWMWRGARILWNLWHHNPTHYTEMAYRAMGQEMKRENAQGQEQEPQA